MRAESFPEQQASERVESGPRGEGIAGRWRRALRKRDSRGENPEGRIHRAGFHAAPGVRQELFGLDDTAGHSRLEQAQTEG